MLNWPVNISIFLPRCGHLSIVVLQLHHMCDTLIVCVLILVCLLILTKLCNQLQLRPFMASEVMDKSQQEPSPLYFHIMSFLHNCNIIIIFILVLRSWIRTTNQSLSVMPSPFFIFHNHYFRFDFRIR